MISEREQDLKTERDALETELRNQAHRRDRARDTCIVALTKAWNFDEVLLALMRCIDDDTVKREVTSTMARIVIHQEKEAAMSASVEAGRHVAAVAVAAGGTP